MSNLSFDEVRPNVWYVYTDPDDSERQFYLKLLSKVPVIRKLGRCIFIRKTKKVTKLATEAEMLPYCLLGENDASWALMSEFDNTLSLPDLSDIYSEYAQNAESAETIVARNSLLEILIESPETPEKISL